MTDRERWIVYPLLFLAIGLAMRSGIQLEEDHDPHKVTDLNVVRCKALEMTDAGGKPRWIMRATGHGEPALDLKTADGAIVAQLAENPSGALLNLYNRTGDVALGLGYESQQVVLLITEKSSALVQPLIAIPMVPSSRQKAAPQKEPPESPEATGGAEKSSPKSSGESKPSEAADK